jgi:hypothetical protein
VFNVRGLVCGCVNRARKFTPLARVMILENGRAKTYMTLLALASRCLVLMYKVSICHLCTYCYAISGTLFPTSGGRPALPVPSPAAISLLPLL